MHARPALLVLGPTFALACTGGSPAVVLELDHAYEQSVDMSTRRAVLLSTRAEHARSTRLPARWELYVERHNALARRATGGKGACRRPTFVLGPAALLQTRPELVGAVRKAISADEIELERSIYIGQLDGEEVLVAAVHAQSPAKAKALQRAVAEAAGADPVVECRIPTLVRMVQPEPSPA